MRYTESAVRILLSGWKGYAHRVVHPQRTPESESESEEINHPRQDRPPKESVVFDEETPSRFIEHCKLEMCTVCFLDSDSYSECNCQEALD
mmetsp:Transcript_22974/g.39435  ORF Transcript_22974/g.39435 Transcript_22974/m.39435 type:complete len:91 (-) Transcript_22974:1200-1472(-)